MAYIVTPDEEREKILELYEYGYSCKDICALCQLSRGQVREVLVDAQIDTRKYRKVPECNKNKVILLIKAGYPYYRIGELLHVSTHLIREIVEANGLIGFAPKNYTPVVLNVSEEAISHETLRELKELYLTGKWGLAKCADHLGVSDDEFVWFVFHLTDEEEDAHHEQILRQIQQHYANSATISAIAKNMNISRSLVKQYCKGL